MSTPWMKFYPRDWRGDQALRAVSLGARGLWMEMLCIMHEASPYGHLVLGGQPVSNDVLARMAGAGVEEVLALLVDLESAGVLSRTRKGVIYSRRMVKDRNRSEKGRKAVQRRYSKTAETREENRPPTRSPTRSPTTQKPEARSQRPEGDDSNGGNVSTLHRTKEKKDSSDRAICAAAADFSFEGRVIRLKRADFDAWRDAFHAIPDIHAELVSLDAWLTGQPDEKRRKWFYTVSGALNRKHQEFLAASAQRERGYPPGHSGIPI